MNLLTDFSFCFFLFFLVYTLFLACKCILFFAHAQTFFKKNAIFLEFSCFGCSERVHSLLLGRTRERASARGCFSWSRILFQLSDSLSSRCLEEPFSVRPSLFRKFKNCPFHRENRRSGVPGKSFRLSLEKVFRPGRILCSRTWNLSCRTWYICSRTWNLCFRTWNIKSMGRKKDFGRVKDQNPFSLFFIILV